MPDQELIRHIENALLKDSSMEELKRKLVSSGWNEKDIQASIDEIQLAHNENPTLAEEMDIIKGYLQKLTQRIGKLEDRHYES